MEEVKKEQPKFDPSKSYGWNDGDVFYLKGKEFGALINNMKTIANTEVARVFRTIDALLPILDEALAKSVENGVAKEVEIKKEVNVPETPKAEEKKKKK